MLTDHQAKEKRLVILPAIMKDGPVCEREMRMGCQLMTCSGMVTHHIQHHVPMGNSPVKHYGWPRAHLVTTIIIWTVRLS